MMDLVADIGATNARFQSCADGKLLGSPVVLATADYDQASDLMGAAISALESAGADGFQQPRCALLAVAGPVLSANEIEVTNTGLKLTAGECSAELGCETHLANDFVALAHGVPHFTELAQIGGDVAASGPKALLGPGSGLGMATLLPMNNQSENKTANTSANSKTHWQVLASEGGHADLAPGSHLESELWALLMNDRVHVSWETVLCGQGLQRLYGAMCVIWGGKPEELTPAQILSRGVSMEDPVCHQTLETFCGLLGAAAGNLTLTVVAVGGVYIGGGIVPRMLEFLRDSPFRRRFEERGVMQDFIQPIPAYVIVEENPGLLGAAHHLANLLEERHII